MFVAFMLVGSFAFANESFNIEETKGLKIENEISNVVVDENVAEPCFIVTNYYLDGRLIGTTRTMNFRAIGFCDGIEVRNIYTYSVPQGLEEPRR